VVASPEIGMIQHRDGHGIHRVPDADALALHQVQGHARIERLHEHERAAVRQRGQGHVETAPGAREGEGMQHPIPRRDGEHVAAVPAVGHRVPVTDDRALGKGRRARGVEDRERVIRADRGGGTVQRGVERVVVRDLEHVGEAEAARVGIVRVHDHVAEARKALGLELAGHRRLERGQDLAQDLQIVHGSQVIGEEQRRRVGLGEDVRELAGLVARVQCDRDGADQRAAVLREEPGGAVGQPQRDLVVLADAEGEECAGEASGLAVERRVADAVVVGDQRLRRPVTRRHHGEHAPQGGVVEGIGGHGVRPRR
jgi:hypothetical protein